MKSPLLERLHQDHRNLEKLLLVLERQFNDVRAGDSPNYELMYQLVDYLTYYPDRCHHVLEDLLFNCLAEKRPAIKPVLQNLHRQHDELAGYGVLLRDMIREILGELPASRAELCQLGVAYVRAYLDHLHCEEEHVFVQMHDALSSADWTRVATTFQWRADPLFAEEADSEYRHLSERIHALHTALPLPDRLTEQTCPICVTVHPAATRGNKDPGDQ